MRMALEACGIKKSERQVAKLLKASKNKGTWNKYFSIVAEKYKLNHATIRNANISDLIEYYGKKYIIIVNYQYKEKTGHYAVLKKIDNKFIYFLDPFFGEHHKYPIAHFKKIWKSNPKGDNEKHWFFAVSK